MDKVILVVEDFDDIRDAIRILIEEMHGFRVVEATDGREAIEKAREHLPDLILMDIAMPAFDGLYATRQIRADPQLAKTPIVAITSYTSEFNETALEAGCDRVISKPTLLPEIEKVLTELLDGQHL
jgi:CheY-like chemotaxis protein